MCMITDEGFEEGSYAQYDLSAAPFHLTVVEQREVHPVHLAVGGRRRRVTGLHHTKQLEHQRE